jgi:hypothetical protein
MCHGLGLRADTADAPAQPCNCVLRAIFRSCYDRFRECCTKEKHISRASLSPVNGRDSRYSWSRKDEEYIADFCLVSRRSLTQFDHKVFRYHFLLGADWRLCCRKLKMDRGQFFHAVYRIQQKLGRVFRELQPYALYPLKEYFSSEVRPSTPNAVTISKVIPIRPPVRKQFTDVTTPVRKVA